MRQGPVVGLINIVIVDGWMDGWVGGWVGR